MDKKYKLKNLTCFNCAGIIERRVNSLDFIESAEVDFDLREIDVNFNVKASKEHEDMIRKEIDDLQRNITLEEIR